MSGGSGAEPLMGLKFLSGPEAGRTLAIMPPVIRLGRLPDNHICLSYDRKASRYHAEVRVLADGGFELADLGSTNGSIHGEERLQASNSLLQPGDTFTVGSTIFLIDHADEILSDSAKKNRGQGSGIATLAADEASARDSQFETVLVADMQNSTETGMRLGNSGMMRLKRRFFDVLSSAAHANRTAFIKGTGDGSMMVFSGLLDALRAVVDIVDRVRQHNESPEMFHPLHVRLSLNSGETLCDQLGDRHGQAVNLCFRLDAVEDLPEAAFFDPSGGRTIPLITTSRMAAAIMQMAWASDLEPIELPPQRCKGFDELIEVTVIPLRYSVADRKD